MNGGKFSDHVIPELKRLISQAALPEFNDGPGRLAIHGSIRWLLHDLEETLPEEQPKLFELLLILEVKVNRLVGWDFFGPPDGPDAVTAALKAVKELEDELRAYD